jgi:5-methyltetrahydrofolate--homocysteine methyltransferase
MRASPSATGGEIAMGILEDMSAALQKGDAKTVAELTKKALDQKIKPGDVLEKGMIAGMSVVGEKFKKNEVYVPEVLIAARAMKAGMEILKPELVAAGVKPVGTAVIGTVKGDLHDIGKNLVAMMLTGGGFEVKDLGTNVDAAKFASEAKAAKAQVVALSALLTTTMPAMKETIAALKQANIGVKTMVGGAPVTQEYADEIGADGYAPDAASAVDKAKELIRA